jgi:GrpB-like predicted nucleotidyltransferase (UPF0157 family)
MTDDLNKLTTEELGRLFPINVVGYNTGWPYLYLLEKQNILDSVGVENIARIEHIGSTAVPGLCAKPTIDILIEIESFTKPGLLLDKLYRIDYQYIPKPENPPPHMMFAKGYTKTGIAGQTYHIHVRYPGDWDEIIFRDYLLDNPKAVLEYAELKRKLTNEFRNDREKYTENKSTFIKQIIQKARSLKI